MFKQFLKVWILVAATKSPYALAQGNQVKAVESKSSNFSTSQAVTNPASEVKDTAK